MKNSIREIIDNSRSDYDYKMNRIVEAINRALKAARLENASFIKIGPEVGKEEYKLPTCEEEVDAFIKSRVKLHHKCWIINDLEQVLIMLGYTIPKE